VGKVVDTDAAWRAFGRSEPYWAVWADRRFRRKTISDADRKAFFESGTVHVRKVLRTIDTKVVPGFAPTRALDFGCGVGRVTIPLAEVCDQVIGVDVSAAMLAEARQSSREVSNIVYMTANDDLSEVEASFDLVHSYIVLQHIEPQRGMRIMITLLDRVSQGGIGVLHLTYATEGSRLRRVYGKLRERVPGLFQLANLLRGRPLFEPVMRMFDYDFPAVLLLFEQRGFAVRHIEPTQHGRHHGATIYAQKAQAQSFDDTPLGVLCPYEAPVVP